MILKTIKNGIKIGKARVVVDIVRKGNKKIRPETYMNPTEIAMHNTGNSGKGANAEAHNRYIHNLSRMNPNSTSHVSWHFTVDDKFIYQHIPIDECAYHTGDGFLPTAGNRKAIGIEICMNKDLTPAQYTQAENNAIELAVHLMNLEKITSVSRVKPHQAYSGKYCPQVILNRDKGFDKFRARVAKAYKAGGAVDHTVTDSKPTTPTFVLQYGNKGALVEEAQRNYAKAGYKIAIDGSFGNGMRETVRKFQEDHGLKVDGYHGVATQKKLLSVVKNIKPNTASKPKKVLQFADKGSDVKALQKDLNALGYSLAIDGSFGNGTLKAVKSFQKDYKLQVDGYFGEKSQAKLKEALKNIDSKLYGHATVIVGNLNVRYEASFKSKIVKVIKKGTKCKVYGEKNGLYNIGKNQYISAGSKYVKFVKNPKYKK